MLGASPEAAIKLAILDADLLYAPLAARHHSYARMFETLLRDAGVDWVLDSFLVIEEQYPARLEDYDAVLITGSKFDSFADIPWIARLRDFVRNCHAANIPMVGICFGHQVLAHALGGEAGRSTAGWGLGVMQYEPSSNPPFMDTAAPVNLIVSHQDQVLRLPPGTTRLLGNDFCPNAAFYEPDAVLAVQGHPEFTPGYAAELLDYRADRLPPDVLSAARESLQCSHDGLRVAGWIRRFVESAVARRRADSEASGGRAGR